VSTKLFDLLIVSPNISEMYRLNSSNIKSFSNKCYLLDPNVKIIILKSVATSVYSTYWVTLGYYDDMGNIGKTRFNVNANRSQW